MRALVLAVLATAVLAAAGCGDPAAVAGDAAAGDGGRTTAPATGSPALGMCAAEAPDCVDVVIDPEGEIPQSFDVDAEIEQAQALLGLAEDELPAGVRVGRRGAEHMALTDDYVLGRDTVELDADAGGAFRVVAVTVELPEGPQTFQP